MSEELAYTDFELLYLVIGAVVLLNAAISWLVFSHLSMRPLEQKLRDLNSDNISDWDGPGWRTATYAIKLVLPPHIWGAHTMFLNPFQLHEIATSADKKRALWFWLSWLIAIAMAFGFSLFFV
ncbi:MAG: hypothetical protein JJU30_14190 [Alkalimonas sp.]|nr:hypothetical protein [Alkalimonas sp.]